MQPWNIAHRGGAQLMPENTLAAFEDAAARGFDGAELDVQLTNDGVVVVHHDFRLKAGLARRNGVWLTEPGPRIKDLSLAELRQFDVGTAQPGGDYALAHPLLKPLDAPVPTLEEVTRRVRGRSFLLFVELKCDGSGDSADPQMLADAAYDVIAAASLLDSTVFVGFDWGALVRVRQRAPTAQCWFTADKLRGDARPVIDAIAAAGGQGWFPNFADATLENVAYARSRGLKVGVWTVNNPADMRRLLNLDAICTDRPDLLSVIDDFTC
ncbi:MAG TPA: glycerophosphodiester phosphodiesterase family protein [Rhizomicrobium sp.]|nr:glycerophosphodiester phosphodiesterase family protein [Rhizomicrobium sp.]